MQFTLLAAVILYDASVLSKLVRKSCLYQATWSFVCLRVGARLRV